MTDDLSRALYDDALPLLARLDAAREILAQLADAQKRVKATVNDLVRAEALDEDMKASLYWMYDDLVATDLLGHYYYLKDIFEARCPWMYPCPGCGVDQPVRSRSQLRELRKLAEGKGKRWAGRTAHWCKTCTSALASLRDVDADARQRAHVERLRQLKTMPYREYLQSAEWQERRKARLRAARYRCQVCNAKEARLNVHHRTYERRGEELAADLIVLCEPCHHLFHRNGSLAPHGDDA